MWLKGKNEIGRCGYWIPPFPPSFHLKFSSSTLLSQIPPSDTGHAYTTFGSYCLYIHIVSVPWRFGKAVPWQLWSAWGELGKWCHRSVLLKCEKQGPAIQHMLLGCIGDLTSKIATICFFFQNHRRHELTLTFIELTLTFIVHSYMPYSWLLSGEPIAIKGLWESEPKPIMPTFLISKHCQINVKL